MEIKERILIKSQELYFARGIRSVTMDDIATALGISKKTIYQHFSDKSALVEASTIFFLEKEERLVCEIAEKAQNPIHEIILSTQMMRDMLANINPSIFHDLQKFYPNVWSHYINHKEKFRDIVTRNLNEGVKRGYYRSDIEPAILATLRIESVDMAFNPEIFPSSQFSILDVQLALIDHFIRGLVTQKGLQAYEEIKEE